MFKHLLIASACLATLTGAAAQSSVTIFGVVDVSARAVDNDDTQYQLASGGLQASRLGFRGTEDLGGGLSAAFHLEGELQPDTGNPNGFNFTRRSTVSLISKSLGELRLGRDKVPTIYEWEDFDPFRDAGVARSTRLSVASGMVPSGSTYTAFVRADNAISYLTPGGLGGVFGQLSVAAGEGRNGNKTTAGRIGWRSGPVMVSASFGRTEVNADDDAEVWSVGGTYDMSFAKAWGYYSELEIADNSQTNWLLGLTVPVGSAELRASYQSMEGDGPVMNGRDATMFGIGGVYNLSKRTALYATYSRIDNDNTNFTVATGSTLTRGNDSSGYEFGIRHAF